MLKQAIAALIGFLAIASAFNATFENSLFSVGPVSGLSYTLFQTRGGIVVYDVDVFHNINSYTLINLETKNTSVILSDIVTACTHNIPTNYDRLHYHVATSSLLYYCIKNNSLLVIDQITYTVELTIPTNVNTIFEEVRLVPQGYSLVVLGMIGVFSGSPGTSELITIDLQSQTVANHIVFNYGLSAGEQVVGYAASSKNSLYILTSTCVDSQNYEFKVTLYSMFLIGNSYNISNITSRTYSMDQFSYVSTELYSVGNLLVVSYNDVVDILSTQGNSLGTIQDLAATEYVNGVQRVALVLQYGNSDFYALLKNSTLLKFNVQNGGYNVETFANDIADMQYVTSNVSSSSLLFTTDIYKLFNITDLQTSQVIYSTISGTADFMVTDTTYAYLTYSGSGSGYLIFVFSRETNLLIFKGLVGPFFPDAKAHLISYMEYTNNSQTQCQMVQFNLQTTNSYVPFVLDPSYGTDCDNYRFLNVTNDLDNPQFLLNAGGILLIMSENYGLVKFGPFEYGNEVVPFVDYDTLTVYIAATGGEISNHVKIFVSTFNPSNNTFTLQGSTQVDEVVVVEIYPLPGQLLITGLTVDGFQAFELVDLSTTLNATVITKYQTYGDFFQDKTGAVYLVIPYDDVYYANQITSLPGINNSTGSGTAVGLCRYALQDSVNDFMVVRFYNVCSNQALLAEIYA